MTRAPSLYDEWRRAMSYSGAPATVDGLPGRWTVAGAHVLDIPCPYVEVDLLGVLDGRMERVRAPLDAISDVGYPEPNMIPPPSIFDDLGQRH